MLTNVHHIGRNRKAICFRAFFFFPPLAPSQGGTCGVFLLHLFTCGFSATPLHPLSKGLGFGSFCCSLSPPPGGGGGAGLPVFFCYTLSSMAFLLPASTPSPRGWSWANLPGSSITLSCLAILLPPGGGFLWRATLMLSPKSNQKTFLGHLTPHRAMWEPQPVNTKYAKV